MRKRLLLIMALAGAVVPASATRFTDIGWDPAASGWSTKLLPTDDLIFAATDSAGCQAAEQRVLSYSIAHIDIMESVLGELQIGVPSQNGLLCSFTGPRPRTGNIDDAAGAAYVCDDVRSAPPAQP